ncbi:MAG: response regulator transcription factor [Clostridiales Family XIII bacterium]|jgi:two-component system response regulator VicR|nr:response regulator transcription factor [Clostridiales Family XIII bacterium]
METKKVLIIEDEKPISDIVRFNLTKEGFETETAYDGGEGLELALKTDPDLVLLDVMLPTMDGFEICKKIREKSNVPIIILTAKEEEVDKVLGLELGADDYITKPFGLRELIARVKANIRRTGMSDIVGADPANVKDFGSITIDTNRYEARKNGVPLDLTLREFELLKYLAEREGKVYSREQLLEDVWGYEYYGDIRTVDVTVRRLREKLEDDSSDPKYVLTKRGVGYYFHRS